MATTVALLGTCDTKLEELVFLKEQIESSGSASGGDEVNVHLIDVGRYPCDHPAISSCQDELINDYYNNDCGPVEELPRGEFVKIMSCLAEEAVSRLCTSGRISGIISAGGSGNTSIAAAVMRNALPLGFPKLIVSTVASGDTKAYVGESDITMMYTVVDIAGTNSLLRQVLSNAGAMIAGAARAYAARKMREHIAEYLPHESDDNKKRKVGITMFGVTTRAVDVIREHLAKNYPDQVEVFVFHATGTGGKAMEKMVRDQQLDAVLDLTTTEIADYVAGGVMSAGEARMSACVDTRIPYLVSLGALDMVNFGGTDTLPKHLTQQGDRKWHEHNPAVTLMRVNEVEAKKIGEFIVEKLGYSEKKGRVKVVIPKGGLSLLSTAGKPFEDREVDEVLFRTVRDGLKDSAVEVIEDERDINDETLAKLMAEELVLMMGIKRANSDDMNIDSKAKGE